MVSDMNLDLRAVRFSDVLFIFYFFDDDPVELHASFGHPENKNE